MTIGIGFDIHRLVAGRRLTLGGIELTYPQGLLGHSDGDVVLHAICDALLGAMGKGDVGTLFPDTDARYKDVSSQLLLSQVVTQIKPDVEIENVDVNIFIKEPKLGEVKEEMRVAIAKILKIPSTRVNIKAKSMNGLGEIGAGHAIAAQAVVSLRQSTS